MSETLTRYDLSVAKIVKEHAHHHLPLTLVKASTLGTLSNVGWEKVPKMKLQRTSTRYPVSQDVSRPCATLSVSGEYRAEAGRSRPWRPSKRVTLLT